MIYKLHDVVMFTHKFLFGFSDQIFCCVKMNAQTLWWLVFLTQIKNFPCCVSNPFILREPTELTATEGSCIEIKLQVKQSVSTDGAHWFWIKDPKWIESESRFIGTIIYSTDQTKRPLSPDFKNRVTFTCTRDITETTFPVQQCYLLICDLNKTDSGSYSFRFEGQTKWTTTPWTTLKVQDNPCPITFEKPPIATENSIITLTCSTLSSCPSKPEIEPPTQLTSMYRPYETSTVTSRVTTVSFTARWMNDGNEFTCQTSDNKDKYLIRRTSIVVEYAPKGTYATISSSRIKEGDTVTLTCSSKGQPNLSFTWFHNRVKQFAGARWTIESIHSSQSGSYYCEAKNKFGTQRSSTVYIDVLYIPDVEVQISKEPEGTLTDIKQGDEVAFSCRAVRSNPMNVQYRWTKDGQSLRGLQTLVFRNIQPEDSGNYTCTATNDAGSGTSKPHMVLVQYQPRNTRISPGGAQNRTVKVNSIFTLTCITDAEPAAWFSWYKQTDSSQWTPMRERRILRLERVQRTDEACYRCNATNNIGMGDISNPVCIQVLYAPKRVTILKGEEQQSGGIRSVNLSCITQCYPEVRKYLWYKKTYDKNGDEKVSESQNFTVNSDQKGDYYCIAENEMNQKTSEPISLFDDRLITAVNIIRLICLLLLICFLIIFLYSRRRNKSNQQGTIQPSCGFLAPSAPMPQQQHGAHLANDCHNYVSLHFGNEKPEEDGAYETLSNAKASNEMERVADYENVSSVCAAKLPDLSDSDSDTSEDEVEVNYSQVNFRPKRGQQRSSSDSTSSEDETQYSQVKIGHHS